MATLFIDYEGGNDNYAGTSFALLASGSDGAITSSTFSSAGASFPNDGSLINQYISIFNGTIYAVYQITAWVSSTSLTITAISGGTALANTSGRQYYIGGRWQTFSNGATSVRTVSGDTIRVMGSPDPTSLGVNGIWTSKRLQTAVSIGSSTNATPIAVTITSHGYSTGDTVVITGHTTNTNANGTWKITVTGANTFTLTGSTGNGVGGATGTCRLATSCVVELASEVTKNIASHGNRGSGRTAWTASTNVTATLDTTDFKEGDCADSIAVGASFTTGLAAYKAIGSTLDLSGYQQLSFWIKQTAGTIGASNAISLKLCSDTAGATPVNTFDIENLIVLNRWVPITINLGSNLGNSIQSVGFYVNTDNAAQTFLISNIIAVKSYSSADSLSLWSLIGKNTSGEPWYPIQSINGTRVMLDCDVNAIPNSTSLNRGYYGTTQTVTTYKRETIKTTMTSAATNIVQGINEGGSSVSSLLTISGGWDRTNMSSQSLQSTIFDGRNSFGYGLNVSSRNYLNISKLGFVRYSAGLYGNSTIYSTYNMDVMAGNGVCGSQFPNISKCIVSSGLYVANNTRSLQIQGFANTISGVRCISGSNFGISLEDASTNKVYDCINYNQGQGLFATRGVNNYGQNIISSGCNYGINSSAGAGGNVFKNCILGDSITTDAAANSHSETVFINTLFNSATEFAGVSSYADLKVYSQNHDNISGYHYIYNEFGWINSTTSTRRTNSGIAWQFNLNSSARTITNSYPMYFTVGTVAVSANSLVTIKAWFQRSDSGMTIGLRVRGNQIAGVPNDITSYMSAAINTWEQISLTFTPTEDGVVEIIAECYGSSAMTGYMDDMTITQV